MVANTDTTLNNISLSANNYFISPSIKMTLPPHLLRSIDFWTKEDVQKWIEYCIDEYALGDIDVNDFEMNGKALALLSEDGFKKRSLRSGDILYQALQQHNAIIKSINCQNFSYQLWNNFGLFPPSSMRHFNMPYPPLPPPPATIPYVHSAFNYLSNRSETDFIDSQQSIRTRQTSNSSSSSVIKSLEKNDIHLPLSSVKQEYIHNEDIDTEQQETMSIPHILTSNSPNINESLLRKVPSGIYSRIKQQVNDVGHLDGNDKTRQIRYYHDRIDFHGDILMKPKAAKNCRILWEFIYILLEDPLYESIIHWENREKMIFRINQADKLAALWGLQKNRLSMTYEKLSRGMRYYYSNNIISKEQSKRLLYRFMRSPDEIRKNMKRHGSTATTTPATNMLYPIINKKSSASSSSSSPPNTNLHSQELSSSQLQNQFLQFLPAYSSMISNLNSANNLLFPTRDNSISKSDRASSSSPESLDSNHDSEKQYCSSLQSCSSATKRKQNIPISLTTRLLHSYPFDQPLNLAVCKEEENVYNYKN
ncbi:unnamed protein product [Adineta steineri]|uniref:Uncharacterized protein n=1 Tax=Adineta steineri TaxID=433720 RepID=A0A815PYE5_9BILA|nr:unnamed protein product [Adineta steineri]CAF1455699.1 unnamed protein product [Adineta steineri]